MIGFWDNIGIMVGVYNIIYVFVKWVIYRYFKSKVFICK